jgi:hypothetical protein
MSAAPIVERIRPFLSAEGARLTFAFAVECCRTVKRAQGPEVDAERERDRSKIEKGCLMTRASRPRHVQQILLPVEGVVVETRSRGGSAFDRLVAREFELEHALAVGQ